MFRSSGASSFHTTDVTGDKPGRVTEKPVRLGKERKPCQRKEATSDGHTEIRNSRSARRERLTTFSVIHRPLSSFLLLLLLLLVLLSSPLLLKFPRLRHNCVTCGQVGNRSNRWQVKLSERSVSCGNDDTVYSETTLANESSFGRTRYENGYTVIWLLRSDR